MKFEKITEENITILEQWFADEEVQHRMSGKHPLCEWIRYVADSAKYYSWYVIDNNEYIGALAIEVTGRKGVISIVANPKLRNCGCATKILDSLKERVFYQSVDVVIAHVAADNEASIRLFESAGYSLQEKDLDKNILTYVYEKKNK